MKKFLILGLFAALSFVACKNAETTNAEEPAVETEEVITPAETTEEAMPVEEQAPAENVAPAEAE